MVKQFGCLGSDSVKVTDSRDGRSCHCFVSLDKKLHYVLSLPSQVCACILFTYCWGYNLVKDHLRGVEGG